MSVCLCAADELWVRVGVVCSRDREVALQFVNLTQLRESLEGPVEVLALIKAYYIPKMESRLACASLVSGVNGEDALEGVCTENVEHLIG